jgi:hypothetical protein
MVLVGFVHAFIEHIGVEAQLKAAADINLPERPLEFLLAESARKGG